MKIYLKNRLTDNWQEALLTDKIRVSDLDIHTDN